MKIVILDAVDVNPGDLNFKPLENLGDVTIYQSTKKEEVNNRIKDAEIILVNRTKVTKEIIDNAKNLKYIGVFASGYNLIDYDYAKEKNIYVTNVPGYSTYAVSQFVFALLLELTCTVKSVSDGVKKGGWKSNGVPLIQLQGKTIGLIGYGQIGREVAKIAKAFGMKVLVYNRTVYKEDVNFVDFDTLLSKSDIISLHCPLFKETTELINEEAINKMKDGVLLINTARGKIIEEKALYKALKSGKIAKAGLDVAYNEPIEKDNPLLTLDNCIITPHIAWSPKETRENLIKLVAENVKCYLEGNPKNVVNGVK